MVTCKVVHYSCFNILGSLPEVLRRPPQLGATCWLLAGGATARRSCLFPLGHPVRALWLRGCGRLVLGIGLGVSLGAWFADGILVGLDWAAGAFCS